MGPNNQPPTNPTPSVAHSHGLAQLLFAAILNIRLYRRQLWRSVNPLDAWVAFPTRSYRTTNEPPRLDPLDEGRTDKGKGKVRAVDSDDTRQPGPESVSMEDDAFTDTL